MNARRLHRADGVDGACELAFKGALVIDLLGKLAGAELLVVHQFKAYRAALGQALLGKLEPRLRYLVGRHHECAATGCDEVTVSARSRL